MSEIWKDIPGYEDIYQINIKGQVKSLPRLAHYHLIEEHLLKPTLRTNGHYVYGLSKNGQVKQFQLHILVADIFNRERTFKNMHGEIWKDVPSDNHLQISNYGRARTHQKTYDHKNMAFCTYRLITSDDNGHGYQFIKYKNNHKNCRVYVHRQVAKLFIPNPHHYKQVNHIDGNKRNNAVSNLEWVTAKQNVHHALNTGLMPSGTRNWNAKLNEKQLQEFWMLVYEKDYTTTELMNHFGLSRHPVLNILNHKSYIREGLT